MRIDGPTNPFHLSRVYGVPAASQVRVAPATNVDAVARVERNDRQPTNLDRLIAGNVPGGIDFSGETAQPTASTAVAMYRTPGAKNAAATSIEVGKRLDISG